ncbi:MAG: M48 family metallopeptidase [Alphaproteobacteria bacterium]
MRSRSLASHPDLPLPVLLCPIRSARRMRLRLDERERLIKVTHPRGIRASAALAWAVAQKEWVEQRLGELLPPQPFVHGALIPIEGVETELRWSETAPRLPLLEEGLLACGGPAASFGRRIERFLRRLAVERLSEETAALSQSIAVQPVSVAVGDARTRWGSCSSSGRIRYSWRLILAPPEARRYVVAHEVAHLKHMNHGPEFRALERELFGGETARAEALLRSAGPRLRRIGIGC